MASEIWYTVEQMVMANYQLGRNRNTSRDGGGDQSSEVKADVAGVLSFTWNLV